MNKDINFIRKYYVILNQHNIIHMSWCVKMSEKLSLSMKFDGKWLMDFARRRYWYEDAEQHAISILECLSGITKKQIMSIINGDVQLTGDSNIGITIVEKPDKKFQKEIKKRTLWLSQNYYKVGEFHVSKSKIHDYFIHLQFLKEINTNKGVTAPEAYVKHQKEIKKILFDSIFHDVSIKPLKDDMVPKKDTRQYDFATALQDFIGNEFEKIFEDNNLQFKVYDKMDEQVNMSITEFEIQTGLNRFDMLTGIPEKESKRIFVQNFMLKKTMKKEDVVVFNVHDPKSPKKLVKIQVPRVLLDNYLNSMAHSDFITKYSFARDLSTEEMVEKLKITDGAKGDAHDRIYHYLGLDKSENHNDENIAFYFQEGLEKWWTVTDYYNDKNTVPSIINIIRDNKAKRSMDKAKATIEAWSNGEPKGYIGDSN